MANKDIIYDYTKKKFFRLSGRKIKNALTSRISDLETAKESLLEAIEPDVKDSVDAAVAIVAVLDPNNNTPNTLKLRACADACTFAINEIQELSMIARNLVEDDLLFYDISKKDMLRFGL